MPGRIQNARSTMSYRMRGLNGWKMLLCVALSDRLQVMGPICEPDRVHDIFTPHAVRQPTSPSAMCAPGTTV